MNIIFVISAQITPPGEVQGKIVSLRFLGQNLPSSISRIFLNSNMESLKCHIRPFSCSPWTSHICCFPSTSYRVLNLDERFEHPDLIGKIEPHGSS